MPSLLLRYVAGVRKRTVRRIAVQLMFRPPVPVDTDDLAVMDDETLIVERVRHGAGSGKAATN